MSLSPVKLRLLRSRVTLFGPHPSCISGNVLGEVLDSLKAAEARAEQAELQRDTATAVVENEQARTVLYINKYEQEVKAREQAERERSNVVHSVEGMREAIKEIMSTTPAPSTPEGGADCNGKEV